MVRINNIAKSIYAQTACNGVIERTTTEGEISSIGAAFMAKSSRKTDLCWRVAYRNVLFANCYRLTEKAYLNL